MVVPKPTFFGATTYPEFIDGVLEYLREHGFKNITAIDIVTFLEKEW